MQARRELAQLWSELDRGLIQDEAELLRRIGAALGSTDAAAELSKIRPPIMRLGDVLMRTQLTEPLWALEEDINVLRRRLDELRSGYAQMFSLCAAELGGIKDLASKLLELYDAVVLRSAEWEPGVLWKVEGFRTLDQTEVSLTTANVDTKSGVLTLGIQSEENIAPQARVRIVPSSAIGVPGCNHLVESIRFSASVDVNIEPEVKLAAGAALTSQPLNAVDGLPTTRFEWELNIVPRKQRLSKYGESFIADESGAEQDIYEATGGYGFRTAIAWDGETYERGPDGKGYKTIYLRGADGKDQDGQDIPTTARCELQIFFDEPRSLSAIRIAPGAAAGGPVVVEGIRATVDGVTWQPIISQATALTPEVNDLAAGYASRLAPVKTGGSEATFWVAPAGTEALVAVRGLSFLLSQRSLGGSVRLAHKYYAQVEDLKVTTTILGFKKSKFQRKVTRLPGPDLGIPIYNTKTSALAKAAVGYVAFGPAGAVLSQLPIVGDAFSGVASMIYNKQTQVLSSDLVEGYDVFVGVRHAVSIRDVELLTRRYDETSVYVSKPFIFEKPVRSIVLTALDQVPASFSSGSWIKYYVSPNGRDWVSCEKDQAQAVPDTNQVYVKVELARPRDMAGLTPVVYSFGIAAVASNAAGTIGEEGLRHSSVG